MSRYSDEFIHDMPKTDLHVHLDGSVRLCSLIDMARKGKINLPSYTEEGMRELVYKDRYADLPEYLRGFSYTCDALRDPENLERAAYELAVDCIDEGVFYIEPRFAPQLLMDGASLTMKRMIRAVDLGLKRAKAEHNARPEVLDGDLPPFAYGIIVCAMRMIGRSGFSPYYDAFYGIHDNSLSDEVTRMAAMELARGAVRIRDDSGIPIVGFDIAGQEAGYPAGNFKVAFDYVHKNFMHKTVHAGEAYGAESIFQAITDLHADRLGHGYSLFDVDKVADSHIVDKLQYTEKLASFVADQRVTIEVCLTSNLQTKPELDDVRNHSFAKMIKRNLSVTLCTDNRLVSNTTISREIRLAVDSFDIDPGTLKNIIVYGFKRSFYPGSYTEKRNYVRRMISYYEKMASKHGVPART